MAVTPKKHPGYKAASDKGGNGLFAELHPSWARPTALQQLLSEALKGGNPQMGVISSPASTSLGQ